MTLSILDWIIITVFLAGVLIGVLRGFIKSVAGVARIVGSFLLAKILGFLFGKLLSLYVIGPRVYAWLETKVAEMVGGVSESMNLNALFADGGEFAALLNRFGAADSFEALKAEYGRALDASVDLLSKMVKSFASPWVDRLSIAIASALVFSVAFFLLGLLVKLLVFIVERISILNHVNRILGAALGLISGIYAVVLVCYCVHFLAGGLAFVGTSADTVLQSVENSVLFEKVYDFVMGIR